MGTGVRAKPPQREVRRRPQSTATRDLIVRTTERAILDLGIARITTRKLADLAAVSEATIFKYWPTKEDLILDALQRRNAPDAAVLDEISGTADSVEAGLRRITSTAVRYYEGIMGPLIAAMADVSILPHHREWLLREAPVAALSAATNSYLSGERRRGRVRDDIDPSTVADMLLGASLRHVVGRMFRGDLPSTRSDNAFSRKLADALALMIASPPE